MSYGGGHELEHGGRDLYWILGHRAPFFRRGSIFALNIFVYVLPRQRRSGIYTTGYLRRPQQENELFPSFLMYDGRFADRKRFRARFCPPEKLWQGPDTTLTDFSQTNLAKTESHRFASSSICKDFSFG